MYFELHVVFEYLEITSLYLLGVQWEERESERGRDRKEKK